MYRVGDRVSYAGKLETYRGHKGTVRGQLNDQLLFVQWDHRPSCRNDLHAPWNLVGVTPVGGVTTPKYEYVAPTTEPVEYGVAKLNDGARYPSTLPNGSAERKEYPLFDVLFGQFPAAMTAIAHHSYKGNLKHNPGKPLQDNRALSKDDKDCILRHLSEGDYEGVAWRAVRALQKKLEQEGAPVAPLATNAEGNY